MAKELLILGIVVAVMIGLVLLLRRAGEKSKRRTPEGVKDRVMVAEAEEAPTRERRRDRARPSVGHKRDLKASKDREARVAREKRRAKEREDEVEDDEDGNDDAELDGDAPIVPTDAEAKAAYKAGLAKTRGGFVARLGKLFGKKKIDADVLGGLEEVLFTADIGPRAADRIFQSVKSNLSRDKLSDPAAIWTQIRKTSANILEVGAAPLDFSAHKPFVLLTIGVNGVGKTTTIGKLASLLTQRGKRVLLAAGDTFRAAATEQLEIWADRAKCDIVKGKQDTDPSSVIFDAIKRGVEEKYDVVICDTAGRLHTKVDLMDELKKVRRVADKAMAGSPHETWLVLDATTGQNAIQQAKTFKETMEITGLVLTKLDGSAKGGVVLGICDELKVPIRYVGIGEKIEDLRPFDAAAFVEALFDEAEEAA